MANIICKLHEDGSKTFQDASGVRTIYPDGTIVEKRCSFREYGFSGYTGATTHDHEQARAELEQKRRFKNDDRTVSD